MDSSLIIIRAIVSEPFEENAYVVHLKGKNDAFIIDPGLEPDKILHFLKKEKLNLTSILITHGHGDHIGGTGVIKAECETCTIYVGEADGVKMGNPNENLSAHFGLSLIAPDADVLVRDSDRLDIAGMMVEVFHTPGHSRGHVVYFIRCEPTPFLFSGDLLFQHSVGRTDFPDGNTQDLLDSIRSKVFTLPKQTIVFPGHGPATTVGEEQRGNPFLR